MTFCGPIATPDKIACIGDAVESSRRLNRCVSFWCGRDNETRGRQFIEASVMAGYGVRLMAAETEHYCDASWEESYVVTSPWWVVRIVLPRSNTGAP